MTQGSGSGGWLGFPRSWQSTNAEATGPPPLVALPQPSRRASAQRRPDPALDAALQRALRTGVHHPTLIRLRPISRASLPARGSSPEPAPGAALLELEFMQLMLAIFGTPSIHLRTRPHTDRRAWRRYPSVAAIVLPHWDDLVSLQLAAHNAHGAFVFPPFLFPPGQRDKEPSPASPPQSSGDARLTPGGGGALPLLVRSAYGSRLGILSCVRGRVHVHSSRWKTDINVARPPGLPPTLP